MNSGSSPASSGAGTSYEAARKRQMELLSEECKKLCNPDVDRSFKDVEDVVDRLLPYHLFYEYDAEEADLDETWDGEGAGLVMSRHDVWQQQSLQMAQRAVDRMEELRDRIRRKELRVFGEVDEQLRQEAYLVEMWLLEQAQARLDATHAALAPTPPPASVPPAALPATPLPAAAASSIAAAAASGLPALSGLTTPAGTALLGSFMQPPPGGN